MSVLRRLFFLQWGPAPVRYQRIVVFLLLPIGDTLFTTPTIHALRQRYPEARIDALAYPTNAGILEGNPDLDRVFLYPTRDTWQGVWAYLRLIAILNARRYDLGVECSPYLWWLSVLCGIPRRLYLDFPIPYWFLPLGKRPWSKRHAIENMASLLKPLGLTADVSRVIVQPTPSSKVAALRFLEEQEIAPHARVLGIHPGGEGFRGLKRWGAAQFATMACALATRHDARVLIFGGPDELELANEVAEAIGPEAIVLNGKVSLGVATALMERCFLFVGNDSAPLHMAAAMGTPTLGIFGPTNPTNYRPVGRHVAIVRSGIACSPCVSFVGTTTLFGGSQCQDSHCLQVLTPERVTGAAEALLRRVEAHASRDRSTMLAAVPPAEDSLIGPATAKVLAELNAPPGG